jgi:hypothetical protein
MNTPIMPVVRRGTGRVAVHLRRSMLVQPEHRERHQERRQQHQDQRDAVEPSEKRTPHCGASTGPAHGELPSALGHRRPPEAGREHEHRDEGAEGHPARSRRRWPGRCVARSATKPCATEHHRHQQRDRQQDRQDPAAVADRIEEAVIGRIQERKRRAPAARRARAPRRRADPAALQGEPIQPKPRRHASPLPSTPSPSITPGPGRFQHGARQPVASADDGRVVEFVHVIGTWVEDRESLLRARAGPHAGHHGRAASRTRRRRCRPPRSRPWRADQLYSALCDRCGRSPCPSPARPRPPPGSSQWCSQAVGRSRRPQ